MQVLSEGVATVAYDAEQLAALQIHVPSVPAVPVVHVTPTEEAA